MSMGDSRRHRGSHPEDPQAFGAAAAPGLHQAVADLSLLLTRGYAHNSTLKLVGDRYNLTARQRVAVGRCSCPYQALEARRNREIPLADIPGHKLLIDGYNLLTTIEAALAGGVLIIGRDSCMRDMASMQGTWRKVQETAPAIILVAQTLSDLSAGECHWLLDAPVSNSGRLKALLESLAERNQWPWTVELVPNPDTLLIQSSQLVVTADSMVLDRCASWLNLARAVVQAHIPNPWVLDFSAT